MPSVWPSPSGLTLTNRTMLEKYGTPRCEVCDSCDLRNLGEVMLAPLTDDHEKTAEMVKTGQVQYECENCGKTCIKPAF